MSPSSDGRQAVAHLQLQARDDRDEVRVAAALAVAVHRALDERRPLGDPRERVGHGALRVVVRVDAERGVRQRAPHDVHRRGDLVRQRGAVGVAQGQVLGAGVQRRAQALDGVRRVVAVAVEEVLGVVDRRACRRPRGRPPTRRSSGGSPRGRRARPSPGAAPRSCRPAWRPASRTPPARAGPRPPRPGRRAGGSSRTRTRRRAGRRRAAGRTARAPSDSRSGSRPRSSARRARRGCARRAPSPRPRATCPRPACRRAAWCRRR